MLGEGRVDSEVPHHPMSAGDEDRNVVVRLNRVQPHWS